LPDLAPISALTLRVVVPNVCRQEKPRRWRLLFEFHIRKVIGKLLHWAPNSIERCAARPLCPRAGLVRRAPKVFPSRIVPSD